MRIFHPLPHKQLSLEFISFRTNSPLRDHSQTLTTAGCCGSDSDCPDSDSAAPRRAHGRRMGATMAGTDLGALGTAMPSPARATWARPGSGVLFDKIEYEIFPSHCCGLREVVLGSN